MSFETEQTLEWNGDSVKAGFKGVIKRALLKSAIAVHADAVANAPVNKGTNGGTLKQSIAYNVSTTEAVVGTPVEYAPHVEFGTRPHTITAKGKGLSDGKTFFGKSVKHPGTKAQPFLFPALTKNIERIKGFFKQEGIDLKWVEK